MCYYRAMEQITNGEREQTALERRVLSVTKRLVEEIPDILLYFTAVADLNKGLESDYTRAELWALPEWHALIGSTYQPEYGGRVAQISAEARDDVLSRITAFIDAMEQQYLEPN